MNLPRLLRTVWHLKPSQILARLVFRLNSVRVSPIAQTPVIDIRAAKWTSCIEKPVSMLAPETLQILNNTITIQGSQTWNDSTTDKLLLYNLHYFDDLVAEQASSRAEWHAHLIKKWIDENTPPYGNGWEPYPLSLRIVNWIKWAISGRRLSGHAVRSLFDQANLLRHRLEFHLMANHLFANAKALLFAGAIFDNPAAREWRQVGGRLIQEQVDEQILGDGGHFELSPMYHAIILEDLLDIANLDATYNLDLDIDYQDRSIKMLNWLNHLCHPDKTVAHFNDSVHGVAPSMHALSEYSLRLGFGKPKLPKEGISYLEDSGYVRVAGRGILTIIDIGKIGPDYQPGHAHCDCLSFEMSVGEQRHLVNTGISTYNNNARRQSERATASHNTVAIEEAEQSEIWSAFRVGRRARPLDVEIGPRAVSAAHDGFRHCGVIHRRCFNFHDTSVEIVDLLQSSEVRQGVAHFHCHPDIMPERFGDEVKIGNLRMCWENADKVEVLEYEYCLGFNDRRRAMKIAVSFRSALKSYIDHEDTVRH